MYKPRRIHFLLYQAQQGRCFHCLEPMLDRVWTRGKRGEKGWTQEHVIPRSQGGGRAGNVVLAHRLCNGRRGNQPLSDIDLARARMIIAAVAARLPTAPPVLPYIPLRRIA